MLWVTGGTVSHFVPAANGYMTRCTSGARTVRRRGRSGRRSRASRHTFMAPLSLIVALLLAMSVLTPQPAAAEPAFRLPDGEVGLSTPFAVSAPGLAAKLATATLEVAGGPTAVEVTGEDSALVSITAREPGIYAVELRDGDASRRLGAVRVGKANVPGPRDRVRRGVVKLRFSPGSRPAELLEPGDVATPLIAESKDDVLQRWYVVDVPAGEETARIRKYSQNPNIEVAEFDSVGEAAYVPTDTHYANDQGAVKKVRFPSLWEARRNGARVAVLDTGVRATHDEIDDRIVHNRDHTGTSVAPCGGHGTGVAGVIAAESDNSLGIAGGAFNAQFGSFKVLAGATSCTGSSSMLEQGISDAISLGYRIINMSLGGYSNLTSTQNVIDSAWNNGAFLVAAAGNDNSSSFFYPAAYNNVFSVASSTLSDTKAPTSNYGGWVDIAAPGDGVVSLFTRSDTDIVSWSGTSFASPLVAAAASVLRAAGLSHVDIENRLRNNDDPVNFGSTGIGGGRLNAYRAYVPAQGCLRDIAQGAFVRDPSNAVYFVDGTILRHVPNPTVLNSWRASSDVAEICNERLSGFTTSSGTFGYRPGSLVQDSNGTLWLIAATSGQSMLLQERQQVSPGARTCFGWGSRPAISDGTGVINLHPTGTPIDVCLPEARVFPSGSVIRGADGAVYVVDGVTKRHVPSPPALASWFGGDEVVAATAAELALRANATDWQMRTGRIVAFSGSSTHYVVTTGLTLATNYVRPFQTTAARTERGWGSAPVAAEGPTIYMLQNSQLRDGDAQT